MVSWNDYHFQFTTNGPKDFKVGGMYLCELLLGIVSVRWNRDTTKTEGSLQTVTNLFKNNSVNLHPHDDRRLFISGPYDDSQGAPYSVSGEGCFQIDQSLQSSRLQLFKTRFLYQPRGPDFWLFWSKRFRMSPLRCRSEGKSYRRTKVGF